MWSQAHPEQNDGEQRLARTATPTTIEFSLSSCGMTVSLPDGLGFRKEDRVLLGRRKSQGGAAGGGGGGGGAAAGGIKVSAFVTVKYWSVSSVHASLEWAGGSEAPTVTDRGSSNGERALPLSTSRRLQLLPPRPSPPVLADAALWPPRRAGTYLNGLRLHSETPSKLADGDVLVLGCVGASQLRPGCRLPFGAAEPRATLVVAISGVPEAASPAHSAQQPKVGRAAAGGAHPDAAPPKRQRAAGGSGGGGGGGVDAEERRRRAADAAAVRATSGSSSGYGGRAAAAGGARARGGGAASSSAAGGRGAGGPLLPCPFRLNRLAGQLPDATTWALSEIFAGSIESCLLFNMMVRLTHKDSLPVDS